jgi:NAD(P)-dependent dehydrogenase (short-subunit alcohol dehydrogenase family)
MLTSRKADQLQAAADTMPGDTAIFAANAGDVAAGRACVEATLERFGRLDVIVNNAATNPYFGPTLGVDESRFDKTFQVNLRGPLFWCQAAWDLWMKDHPGVMVNIASVGGMRAESGWVCTTSPRPP